MINSAACRICSIAECISPYRPPPVGRLGDIVALMTFEHQTRMANLMIRAGWDARIESGKAASDKIDSDVEALVTFMLFADEARLYDPIKGVSTFTKTFAERGPRDHQGRSLRDFDLEKRMFRYPLSYAVQRCIRRHAGNSARKNLSAPIRHPHWQRSEREVRPTYDRR